MLVLQVAVVKPVRQFASEKASSDSQISGARTLSLVTGTRESRGQDGLQTDNLGN